MIEKQPLVMLSQLTSVLYLLSISVNHRGQGKCNLYMFRYLVSRIGIEFVLFPKSLIHLLYTILHSFYFNMQNR
jgi:hypothetical protein